MPDARGIDDDMAFLELAVRGRQKESPAMSS